MSRIRVAHTGLTNPQDPTSIYGVEDGAVLVKQAPKVVFEAQYSSFGTAASSGDKTWTANLKPSMYDFLLMGIMAYDSADADLPGNDEVFWNNAILVNAITVNTGYAARQLGLWYATREMLNRNGTARILQILADNEWYASLVLLSGVDQQAPIISTDSDFSAASAALSCSYTSEAGGMVVEYAYKEASGVTFNQGTTWNVNTYERGMYIETTSASTNTGVAAAAWQGVAGVALRPDKRILVPQQGRDR